MKQTKYTCDRCGREIGGSSIFSDVIHRSYTIVDTTSNVSETYVTGVEKIENDKNQEWADENRPQTLDIKFENIINRRFIHMDLCPNCSKKLQKFLSMEGNV